MTNAQRRRRARAGVKVAAFGTFDPLARSWRKRPQALACDRRDPNGHRCRDDVDHRGNHRSFGREWK